MSSAASLPPFRIPVWRRAVLKVGSNLLAAEGGGLDDRHAGPLAAFVQHSVDQGREVVLVSSGAVAAGRAVLRQHALKATGGGLAARQALAAMGQVPVLEMWRRLSARPVAQVLLSHDDIRHRRRYLNARATLRELLALDVLAVVNENDTVAVDELKLGDNDNLAAIVASLIEADVLLIASDIDALYTGDPRIDAAATPIRQVSQVTPEIMAMAGGSGSVVGTGGMRTKLKAAVTAAGRGIPTALFDGRSAATVAALGHGELHGTWFHATAEQRLHARKHWLRHLPAVAGGIRIDEGARHALSDRRASLLPGGIVQVDGEFRRGDMVAVYTADGLLLGQGLCQYGAAEVRCLAGQHSRDIERVLGYSHGTEVIHRDDLVVLDRLLAGAW
ncbi:glutamate 5-kinase [Frateuria aurantia]|uniref:Glutamate 5-kinase n=1 Tax=Frateuria aurantia (strain ATCC 33424 / DSM 6220 / KCTC 2777 / LMG 1558 / NBRC 3245 / NCIMB 13370) TaxID=767434 RepID=H8L3G6_FRAAD|nr:glutamate 5-kinase [Frateuria aurantia]AFC86488.1 glutamate 5-kinase [Frateuria aurantia DSM 6220]